MNRENFFRFLLNGIEEIVCCILLLAMSVFAFLNVISRYVMHFPLNFADELNIYFFVWLTLAGSSLAFKRGAHMCISILYDRLPGTARLALYIVIHAVIIGFFAILCYFGILEVQDEMFLNAVTEAMQLPIWYFTIGVPVGSLIIIVRILQKCALDLREGKF
ncbi:MAG: TRAP transporter small permease [Synergistaceae bacterium]|nr:TRAP transporter small permease [Synergistaceae bacterium]